MNQPRRHHYIPDMLLARFTVDDGRLWLCRKDGDKTKIFKTGTKKAFTVNHLYRKHDLSGNPDLSVEEALGVVESAASPVIDRIVGCSLDGHCPRLTASERETLIRFIDHQHRRTPENHALVDEEMENWEADILERFESKYGQPPTEEELADIEDPELRKTASQSMKANLAGLPIRTRNLKLYAQCPIRFRVIRNRKKSFVIGSRIEPGDWFPVHRKVAFRLVTGNGPDELTEIRDMADVRRINEQTVRDSLAFGGASEQLVRSLAGSR